MASWSVEHLRADPRNVQLRAAWPTVAQGRRGAGRGLACRSACVQRKQVRPGARSPLAPMIDRAGESASLAEMWQQSAAGLGTGRRHFRRTRHRQITFHPRVPRVLLDGSPRDILSLQCSPFHVNTPLAPEIERLRRGPASRKPTTRSSLGKIALASGKEPSRCRGRTPLLRGGVVDPGCARIRTRGSRVSLGAERAFQVLVDALIAASRKRPSWWSSRTSSGWTRPASNCSAHGQLAVPASGSWS